jgi:hypothetical protein
LPAHWRDRRSVLSCLSDGDGGAYSFLAWARLLAERQPGTLDLENARRRRTGRAKGVVRHSPRAQTRPAPPAEYLHDPGESAQENELVERLRNLDRLLRSGMSLDVALPQVMLPDKLALAVRADPERLLNWAARFSSPPD